MPPVDEEFSLWHAPAHALPLWAEGAPGFDPSYHQPQPTLTPFLVEGSAPRPGVIVCPGGGYVVKAAHEAGPVAEWLNRLGYHAFVLDYRVSPYRHPIPLLDVRRAVQLTRAHAAEWHVQADRVGVLGFSAGGHLTASVGTQLDDQWPAAAPRDAIDDLPFRPDALILCYAVISFCQGVETGSFRNLLGDAPAMDERTARSAEQRASAQTPPSFIWHTADDAVVPVQNATLFADALTRNGVPFELHVFAHGAHGVGLAFDHPSAAPWTDLCARWLKNLW